MIFTRGNREIVAVSLGRRAIAAVWRGARLVWEAVSSCFGRGYWKGDEPWNGADAWRGGADK